MARRFLYGRNVTFGLNMILFAFRFVSTLLVPLAVVVFFVLAYPRLRKSSVLDRERGAHPRRDLDCSTNLSVDSDLTIYVSS